MIIGVIISIYTECDVFEEEIWASALEHKIYRNMPTEQQQKPQRIMYRYDKCLAKKKLAFI